MPHDLSQIVYSERRLRGVFTHGRRRVDSVWLYTDSGRVSLNLWAGRRVEGVDGLSFPVM